MQLLIMLALFAQLVLPRAYTTLDPTAPDQLALATQDGVLAIELGPGCDGITSGQNVEVLFGSGNVGSIRLPGSDQLCQIAFTAQLSDEPCAQNADGECDVGAES